MAAEHVPAQIQVGLERFAAEGAGHVRRIVDQLHVLAQVREVAVDAAALLAGPRLERVRLADAAEVRACNKTHALTPSVLVASSADPPVSANRLSLFIFSFELHLKLVKSRRKFFFFYLFVCTYKRILNEFGCSNLSKTVLSMSKVCISIQSWKIHKLTLFTLQ